MNLHTLELSKPLYQAADEELYRLCNYLEEQRFARYEEDVQQLVDLAYGEWQKGDGMRPTMAQWVNPNQTLPPPNPPGGPFSTSLAFPVTTTSTHRIIVKLPEWVPPAFARPMIERMIREQVDSIVSP